MDVAECLYLRCYTCGDTEKGETYKDGEGISDPTSRLSAVTSCSTTILFILYSLNAQCIIHVLHIGYIKDTTLRLDFKSRGRTSCRPNSGSDFDGKFNET